MRRRLSIFMHGTRMGTHIDINTTPDFFYRRGRRAQIYCGPLAFGADTSDQGSVWLEAEIGDRLLTWIIT